MKPKVTTIIEEKKQPELIPWHEKLRRYNEIKKKIFEEPTKRIAKARERYKSRQKETFRIDEARLYEGTDTRIYAKIDINGEEIDGLLDSGATVSCLELNCLDFVERIKLNIFPYSAYIKTADGRSNQIIGRVKTPITFNMSTKDVVFYLVPSLKQVLFLGIDFMRAFNLIQINIDSISTNKIALVDVDEPPTYPRMHVLPTEHQNQLNEEVIKFPCFTTNGPGKTLLEPSESPWSNRVAFVRKGDKCRLCLDARRLNALTVKDAYTLPHIEGLLSRLGDTYYISSIDLKDAFWQIPLEQASREKTAFTIPGRSLYQFTVMPFVYLDD